MRKNSALTRIECCGIVDGDHRSSEEVNHLRKLGIAVLPVAEVENTVLLPPVSRAIAEHEGHNGEGLDAQMDKLRQAVFQSIESGNEKRSTVQRYLVRQVDRHWKRINLDAKNSVSELDAKCAQHAENFDIRALAADAEYQISTAIENEDLPGLLIWYDNKGLLALAATHLKGTKVNSFKEWLERILRQDAAPGLTAALRDALPKLP